LKPAADVLLLRGWYAPVETPCAAIIAQLFANLKAPVLIAENSPALNEAIVAEDNETQLSMVDKILTAINWRMTISGSGVITIEPKPKKPSVVLSDNDCDIVVPEFSVDHDGFSAPNVFRAESGDLSAIARDDSEDSLLSVPSRGREVWAEESGCTLAAGESLADYALRKLKELQRVGKTVNYSRRYIPGLVPGDIVRLHFPEIDLQGNFIIQSQSFELDFGAETEEGVASE
jgi:hypothetical protein